MKYSIEGVIEKYHEINIGVLVGKGLNINRLHPDLEKYKSDAILVAEDLIGCNSITRHPYIARTSLGAESFPSKFKMARCINLIFTMMSTVLRLLKP